MECQLRAEEETALLFTILADMFARMISWRMRRSFFSFCILASLRCFSSSSSPKLRCAMLADRLFRQRMAGLCDNRRADLFAKNTYGAYLSGLLKE